MGLLFLALNSMVLAAGLAVGIGTIMLYSQMPVGADSTVMTLIYVSIALGVLYVIASTAGCFYRMNRTSTQLIYFLLIAVCTILQITVALLLMPLESATPELADAAKSIGAPFSILLLAALSLNAVVLAYSAYSLYRISRDRSDKQHEQQRKLSEMQVSAQASAPRYLEYETYTSTPSTPMSTTMGHMAEPGTPLSAAPPRSTASGSTGRNSVVIDYEFVETDATFTGTSSFKPTYVREE